MRLAQKQVFHGFVLVLVISGCLNSFLWWSHGPTTSSVAEEGITAETFLPIYWIDFRNTDEHADVLALHHRGLENKIIRVPAVHQQQVDEMLLDGRLRLERKNTADSGNQTRAAVLQNLADYRQVNLQLSHLQCMERAYSDGREIALIVEGSTIGYSRLAALLDHISLQAIELAPVDWQILTLTMREDHPLTAQAQQNVYGDAWVNYYVEAGSSAAYLIRRREMKRILTKAGRYIESGFMNFWNFPMSPRKNGYFLPNEARNGYLMFAQGSIFMSTFPFVLEPAKWEKAKSTSRSNSIQLLSESIFVYTTAQFKNPGQLQAESHRLRQDVDALCRLHHRKDRCFWAVHLVTPKEGLLKTSSVVEEISQLSTENIQVYAHFVEGRYNKFRFLRSHLEEMEGYDYFLFKDNDQRIAGLPWRAFMEHKGNAILSSVLRASSLAVPSRQHFTFLDGRAIWYNPNDKCSWATERFMSVTPLEVEYIEQYFGLFDVDFARWFFSQSLTAEFVNQTMDWGPDSMWCGAAQEYITTTTTTSTQYRNTTQQKQKQQQQSCVLVPVMSLHEDSRQIKRNRKFLELGRAVKKSLDNNPIFRNWVAIQDSWQKLVGGSSCTSIQEDCTTMINDARKKSEMIPKACLTLFGNKSSY